jgi:hypothetical protein
MKKFFIPHTEYTPEIKLEEEYLSIVGESFPENSFEFFAPLIDALDRYSFDKLNVKLYFHYLNSGSIKMLFDIFDKLCHMKKKGVEVVVIWGYDEKNLLLKELIDDFIVEFKKLQIEVIGE